ncbi:MAG: flavin prenyltransferase UbiX [Cyanobacteriota/Melainabacteria group bacterium]
MSTPANNMGKETSTDKARPLPVVLAITGASGAIYGLRTLQFLAGSGQPCELLISKAAYKVMQVEHDLDLVNESCPKAAILNYLKLPPDAPVKFHELGDYAASVASGSYRTRGMAVVPCSLGTLGALANGLTANLIQRAAAVCLKEKRPLVIVVREMPFGHIQLKNMLALSEAGATVACASPGFYHRPRTIQDQIDFVVGRILDQLGFDNDLFKRWKEETPLVQVPEDEIQSIK